MDVAVLDDGMFNRSNTQKIINHHRRLNNKADHLEGCTLQCTKTAMADYLL